jgi:uncharacterized phiE125 gp8 family phage protein
MTSYLLAGPAAEPIALAQAKAFLKVDDDAEDALIETLIASARMHVEGVTGKALMEQSWRLVLDGFPASGIVRLPVSPLLAVTAVTVTSEDAESEELNLDGFTGEGDQLVVPKSVLARAFSPQRCGIEIDYKAGFGADSDDVPADIKQAMLGLIAHWYEFRDAVIVAGTGAIVPNGFDALVSRYKRIRL